jgi:hypothetical protein
MHQKLIAPCVGLLLLSTGCNWFKSNLLNKNNGANPPQSALEERPTPERLIAYLNRNASDVHSLQATDLAIEAKMGLGLARSIQLTGTLQAEGPHNFRMEGKAPGTGGEVVDLGSNDREFWFWISENKPPYLFYCSHADLPKARLPLPIHPDWIMEALGMATITPSQNFRVNIPRGGNTIELIEDTRSPQGQRMQKVTVFNSRTVAGTEPQVMSRRLIDHQGKVICEAVVKEMQQDPHTRLVVPHRLDLIYPGDGRMDRITLSLVLDTIAVNVPIDPSMAWFTRPNKPGVQSFDLGRQMASSPSYRNSPGGVVPSGGTARGTWR